MADLRPLRTFSIEKIRNLLIHSINDLNDARVTSISLARRFDAAYDAGFCCALALLEASKLECTGPGHHRDALEFLVKVLGVKGKIREIATSIWRMRNANRYDAVRTISPEMVEQAIEWAAYVQIETEAWFRKNLPQALKT